MATAAVLSSLLTLPGAPRAQQSGEGAVFQSPIPQVRNLRGLTQDTAETGQDEQESADEGGQDQPTQVRVITPGEDGTVTVVFNGRNAEDQGEEGDAAQPRWQRERDERFVRAPEREPLQRRETEAPIVPINTPSTELRQGARLRQLDKMTGKTQTFDIAVGESRRVERLQIRLDACRAPNDNDTHGTMVFIKVWDTRRADEAPDFSGWMFAESPALSALDHPRYDLWVISCTTSEG